MVFNSFSANCLTLYFISLLYSNFDVLAMMSSLNSTPDRIKAQKLFEASTSGGSDLFKEMKKSHGGKHSPGLPENVAGANGEEEICKKF